MQKQHKAQKQSDSYVRARIDSETKARATDALEAMGLSVSDVIRLLMIRIADEHRLPFEVRVPNNETKEAIMELESAACPAFESVDAFMDDLNNEDD